MDAGVPIGEIATGATSTKADTFVQITKETQSPELVELIVNAPLVNDNYSLDFNCPVSAPIEIVETTQINIWFDDSGSMNGTLSPLQNMVNNELKSCLIQFYNNDEAAYNKYVSVREYGGRQANNPVYYKYNEKFPVVMSWEPDITGATNCINLVFQDEIEGIYQFGSSANPSFINDIWKGDVYLFKQIINNNRTGYVTPVLFQIATYTYEYAFGRFLDIIENGEGAYAPSEYNLKDMAGKYTIKRDIIPSNPNSTYYRDQIIQVFNELGFNITCP